MKVGVRGVKGLATPRHPGGAGGVCDCRRRNANCLSRARTVINYWFGQVRETRRTTLIFLNGSSRRVQCKREVIGARAGPSSPRKGRQPGSTDSPGSNKEDAAKARVLRCVEKGAQGRRLRFTPQLSRPGESWEDRGDPGHVCSSPGAWDCLLKG